MMGIFKNCKHVNPFIHVQGLIGRLYNFTHLKLDQPAEHVANHFRVNLYHFH